MDFFFGSEFAKKKAGSFRAGRSLLLEELLEVIEIDCCDESLLMEVKSSQITNLAGEIEVKNVLQIQKAQK
jgi:predicted metal-dependent HD superfamily phosphohydrolase